MKRKDEAPLTFRVPCNIAIAPIGYTIVDNGKGTKINWPTGDFKILSNEMTWHEPSGGGEDKND